MKITSKEAKEILEQAIDKTQSNGWIFHSLCVGNTAERIAAALKEKGLEIDVEKTKTLGYLHDIGKKLGNYSNHVMNGYYYMKEQGYDEDYCNISLTHSYLNNDINCTAAGFPDDIPFRTNFIKNHQYTLEEKIINLCDLMCTKQVVTIEKRLIDLYKRRGIFENTAYHLEETFKLKNYFDQLLGHNVYDLFSEIKENI